MRVLYARRIVLKFHWRLWKATVHHFFPLFTAVAVVPNLAGRAALVEGKSLLMSWPLGGAWSPHSGSPYG